MTLSVLALLSVVLVPLALGVAVLRVTGWQASGEPLLALGFAYVSGALGVGLLEAAWLACGAPLDARLQVPVVALAALALWRLAPRPAGAGVPAAGPRATSAAVWGLRGVLFLLLALHAAAALQAALSPVMLGAGDEANNWALKAKLLFDAGSLGTAYAERLAAFDGANADYPLLNPLLQVWTFAHAGRVLHVENRIPIQLAMLALLCLACAGLRRTLRPELAALLLLVLGTAREGFTLAPWAGADVLAALGLLAAVEGALRWRASGASPWFRLTALALAFLVWSKNEGLLYALVLVPVLLTGAPRRASAGEWAWLLLPAAIAGATAAFNARSGFAPQHLEPAGALERLTAARIGAALAFAARMSFLRPALHGGLFAALALFPLLAPRQAWRGAAGRLTLFLWLLVGGLLGVYVLSPLDLEWALASSAARVFYHLAPSAALWLGLVLAGAVRAVRAQPGPG